MKKVLVILLMAVSGFLASCSTETESVDSTEMDFFTDDNTGVEFVYLEGDTGEGYYMATIEVSNQQYVDFLNDAYLKGVYNFDEENNHIYTIDGYSMIDLNGSRVVKDHNNDGEFALDEMENPLNRCFIEFNEESNEFQVVDPITVDWTQYFDTTLYPNVVDSIEDWAELNDGENGFYGNGDTDKLLPTLEEVKEWPVNFIRYYGAKEFANYYGYDLPTREQWVYAARGGEDFKYATNDGTDSEDAAWLGGTVPGEIHKGHVQSVYSLNPNPYGIYNLGGNVWEWTKEWATYTSPSTGEKGFGVINEFYINDDQRSPLIELDGGDGTDNQFKKSLMGGSFNYFSATTCVTCTSGIFGPTMNLNSDGVWEHGAYIHAGNDHFGFRVVTYNK